MQAKRTVWTLYAWTFSPCPRKVPGVPQVVRREPVQGGGEATALPHDGQDRPPELLDDAADRRAAFAGAERGPVVYTHDIFVLYYYIPGSFFDLFTLKNIWTPTEIH